eukprot:TRINITY_DN31518_c0_g1_i1.p1 TRINITY_DN31518_c0_g1~~TRINITY_DN31518_c0_g1_i1.p1  ORF type:complete len:419 (+),score=94.68 TRINITY_DN31518_c0_g1_i1:38-1258(+)
METYEAKVQTVFLDMDSKKLKVLSFDQFSKALVRLGLNIPAVAVQDLHRKTDVNMDGVIDYDEWQRFAEAYPTLLDCLYYRIKDYWFNVAQKESIAHCVENIAILRDEENKAQAAHHATQTQVNDFEMQLSTQAQHLSDANNRQLIAESTLNSRKHDTTETRRVLDQRKQDLATSKENERAASATMKEAQRTVEASIRRVQSHEAALSIAHERQKELEALLQEQRKIVEQHRLESDKCRLDLSEAENISFEASSVCREAIRSAERAKDSVIKAEVEVSANEQLENEATLAVVNSQAEVKKEMIHLEELGTQLTLAKCDESKAKQRIEDLKANVRMADKDLQELQREEHTFAGKRLAVSDEETPLIDQEMKLRAVRSSLENEEAKLVSDFANYTGRVPRSASRPTKR